MKFYEVCLVEEVALADLDEILRSMFGGSGGGFGGGSFGGFGGMGGRGVDLDIQSMITIPFITSIMGGTHSVSANGSTFDIKIPAGIKSGESMRVRGKGKKYQGQAGDLILKIEIAESSEYERKGDDLYKTFDLPLKDALFGGVISIETPDKTVSLKVPQNTRNSQRFRLKGKGVVDRKTALRGDLFLVSNIILPDIDSMDSSLLELMKEKL